ncbi:MAG: LptF/LptG family permease [Candidatus Xenobia bacterium]
MKILDRYIIAELLGPLLTGAATFTLLFMSMDTLFRVAHMLVEGIAIGQAMSYLLDSIPSILVLTLPMAVLLACLLAFGRLSSDSELTAIKAGGVGFTRIALPGIMLALVVSLCSYVLNEKVVPDALYKAHNFMIKEYSQNLKQNITFNTMTNGSESRVFARKLDQNLGIMYDMTMQDYSGNTRTQEVYAKRVVWETGRWIMYDVYTYNYDKNQQIAMEGYSKSALLSITDTPHEIAARERLPEEMSREGLENKIKALEASDPKAREDVSYNRYVLLYHEKLTIPFTCLVFGLLGMPLGVRPQRTSPSVGLGISLIFILFYYVLMTVSHTLGENSVLPAGVAAWIPNLVFGALGVHLVVRAGRS